MTKKWLYLSCLSILLLATASAYQEKAQRLTDSELISVATSIHKRVLTLDAHVDIEVSFITPESYQGKRHEKLFSYEDMVKGGMDAVFLAVYTAQGPRTQSDYKRAIDQASRLAASI